MPAQEVVIICGPPPPMQKHNRVPFCPKSLKMMRQMMSSMDTPRLAAMSEAPGQNLTPEQVQICPEAVSILASCQCRCCMTLLCSRSQPCPRLLNSPDARAGVHALRKSALLSCQCNQCPTLTCSTLSPCPRLLHGTSLQSRYTSIQVSALLSCQIAAPCRGIAYTFS